jgi:hypothetical protein
MLQLLVYHFLWLAPQPILRQGRPSTPAAKQVVRTKKRLEAQRTGLSPIGICSSNST